MSTIEFSEYGEKVPATIRERAPKCPFVAVIPSLTVESVANLKDLADCFVHVTSNNTTYYIDDKHRVITVWAGPVILDNYDYEANPNGIRSQEVWDFANSRIIRYNATGQYLIFQANEG